MSLLALPVFHSHRFCSVRGNVLLKLDFFTGRDIKAAVVEHTVSLVLSDLVFLSRLAEQLFVVFFLLYNESWKSSEGSWQH